MNPFSIFSTSWLNKLKSLALYLVPTDFKRQHFFAYGNGALSGSNYTWETTTYSGTKSGALFTLGADGILTLNVDCYIEVEYFNWITGAVYAYSNLYINTTSMSGPSVESSGGSHGQSAKIIGSYPAGTTFKMVDGGRNYAPTVRIAIRAEVNPF